MDWNAAIEKNREALKRVLAGLVAMAALPVLRACGDAAIAGGAAFTSPLCGLRGRSSDRASGSIVGREGRGDCEAIGDPGKIREASGGGCVPTTTPTRRPDDRRPPHKGEVELPATLPRHLHRAVLRLLRPAEAAARRLVIVAARGLAATPQARKGEIVPPPAPPRLRKPNAASPQARKTGISILRNGPGTGNRTGILMPALPQASLSRTAPRTLALPLFDPLRLPRHYVPLTRSVPRISFPGFTALSPVSPRCPPSPRDPIDARRLALRLQALGRALDDLPRQARRFARWRNRRDAAGAQNKESCDAVGTQNKKSCDAAGAQSRKRHRGPFRRVWPLRPGRPPGWCRNPKHEVHEILNVAHGLAIWALKSPDTS